MFSFTKRADYALLALSYLTIAGDGSRPALVNTKEIAEHFHIPVELMAKIMQVLAKNGIVRSSPGPTGGYRLTRDPSTITIAEVVNLIDGQVGIVHCSNGNEGGCDQFSQCTIRNPLSVIEERMNAMLAQMSVREISQASDGVSQQPAQPRFSSRTFSSERILEMNLSGSTADLLR